MSNILSLKELNSRRPIIDDKFNKFSINDQNVIQMIAEMEQEVDFVIDPDFDYNYIPENAREVALILVGLYNKIRPMKSNLAMIERLLVGYNHNYDHLFADIKEKYKININWKLEVKKIQRQQQKLIKEFLRGFCRRHCPSKFHAKFVKKCYDLYKDPEKCLCELGEKYGLTYRQKSDEHTRVMVLKYIIDEFPKSYDKDLIQNLLDCYEDNHNQMWKELELKYKFKSKQLTRGEAQLKLIQYYEKHCKQYNNEVMKTMLNSWAGHYEEMLEKLYNASAN